MEKNHSKFPWYVIYAPVIALVLITWRLDTESGDGPMDVLERILNWLGLDNNTISNIVIIAIAVIVSIYIVTRWISTNKRLKSINDVAETAPGSLDERIKETGKGICEKIDNQDRFLIRDITEIKSSTSAVQRQIENFNKSRQDVPIQQDSLIAIIHEIYSQHDRDQQTIAGMRTEINRLEAENANLKRKKQELEKIIQNKYQHNTQRREQDDWEREV